MDDSLVVVVVVSETVWEQFLEGLKSYSMIGGGQSRMQRRAVLVRVVVTFGVSILVLVRVACASMLL